MSVGLIAALPAEIRCFSLTRPVLNQPFAITPRLTAIICGMGRNAAGQAAKKLLDLNIEALISWGTAGALSPHVRSGDLLLPEKYISADGVHFSTCRDWLDRIKAALPPLSLTVHSGPMAETRTVLTGTELKYELHQRTQALAADMESAAILENAAARNLPCILIRAVVDDSDTSIPAGLVKALDPYGRPDITALLLEMMRSPHLLIDLYRLGTAMHRATSTLRTLVRAVNPTLMYKP